MAFNYSKLKGKIIECWGSYSKFAERIGLSSATLSLRLNNKICFSQEEIIAICKELGIKDKEISLYFFEKEVKK